MGDYEQHVKDFYSALETCDTNQRSFCEEVFESLNAINEVKLLEQSTRICSNDDEQLLYKDILELCRNLQSEVEERLTSYQKSQQEADEDQLYHLHRKVSMLLLNSTVVKFYMQR